MECARSARNTGIARTGRGPFADDATRQAHQCGFPDGSFDPARQHHDTGAGRGNDARFPRAGIIAGRDRSIALTAPGFGGAHGGQETDGGEIISEAGAGSACAGRARAGGGG